MESPLSKRKHEYGKFRSSSRKRGFAETSDKFRERCLVE